MIQAVHQFHPVLGGGDAVSNQILRLQQLLRARGLRSEIYVEHARPSFEASSRALRHYQSDADGQSVLLCHYSIGYSPQVLGWLQRAPGRRVLLYHNITPSATFIGVSQPYREAAWLGREQLGRLVGLMGSAWGVSAFNCAELARAGWPAPCRLPIIFDPNDYPPHGEPRLAARLAAAAGPRLLFVGRLVPNKRFEELILTHHALRRLRPQAELHLAGAEDQMERYRGYLDTLIERLGVGGVHFHGHVSQGELVALFQGCDLFLCLSEHEGFGVPLIEAMHFGLPVVAYGAAAVPETLGGAGVLLHQVRHDRLAALLDLLLSDAPGRAGLIEGQRARVRRFLPGRVAADLDGCLAELSQGRPLSRAALAG